MIKELTCDELNNRKIAHDISISDDGTTLALACREEMGETIASARAMGKLRQSHSICAFMCILYSYTTEYRTG